MLKAEVTFYIIKWQVTNINFYVNYVVLYETRKI